MKRNVVLCSAILVLGLGLSTSCTNPSKSNSDLERLEQIQSNRKPRIFSENGIAIRGYDPVAYFTESKPVAGKSEFSHEWQDTTWQFATAENRDLFKQDPEKYAPQYGGYCAWAVKEGTTAPIDPQAWEIVSGKLYLNLNPSIQKQWQKDIPGYIAQADQNWPDVLRK